MNRKQCIRPLFVFSRLLIVGSTGWAASSVQAVVTRIDAEVETTVQQFIEDEVDDFDSAFEEFRETSNELPLFVEAHLVGTTPAGDPIANGDGFANFDDPTVIEDSPNPAAVGLEGIAFSQNVGVSYVIESRSAETRLAVFTMEDLLLVDNPDRPKNEVVQDVVSRTFISGAGVIWGLAENTDLTDALVEVAYSVNGTFADGSTMELLSGSARIEGLVGGEIADEQNGELEVMVGDSDLLASLGADTAELSSFGELYVLIVPDQEIPYTYTVAPDEEVELKFDVTLRVSNAKNGVGAAGVVGRSFANMIDTVGQTAGVEIVAQLQTAMNTALDNASNGNRNSQTPSVTLCGAFGFEAMGLMSLGFAGLRYGPRRRPVR
jgi:hypothetical protein